MYALGTHTQVVLLAQQAGYPHPARMTSVLVLHSPGGAVIHRLLCVLPCLLSTLSLVHFPNLVLDKQ